jgi:predicted lipoprotein with Yx(FWY)xxD motif
MRPIAKFLLPALAASLTIAACGSSSKGSGSASQAAAVSSGSPASTAPASSEATSAIVKTASNPTLGATVLVDTQGRTLYHLSGEQNGNLICTSAACLQVWHPVSASTAGGSNGSVASLGTVKRPDGTEQVTYKGMPLYTFTQDQQAGEVRGEGIKDVGTWSAVTTSAGGTGATQSSQSAEPAPATSSSSSGGYGY